MKQASIAMSLLAAILAISTPSPVRAEALQDSATAAEIVVRLGEHRSRGCESDSVQHSGSPLQRDTRPDRAAALMLDGDSLADAMKRAR